METLIPRKVSFPDSSFFLFGPRGTGKTTLLRYKFPDALWIDLLEPDTLRQFSSYPERLREMVMAQPKLKTVIIDEVQKVPVLLDMVHWLIEKKLKIKFILTGSSSRKLKKTGVDLLAGRALLKTLHPFLASEIKFRFKLSEALKTGMLPLVIFSDSPDQTLKTYIALYLKEEVQMEGLVRNFGNFARFLEAISFSHGSICNISNIARDCEVERKTVEGFISILEDLLLSYRLPVFSKRAKRVIIAHPKFYFFDTGVFRSLRPTGPLDNPSEIDGAALEGLVLQHLIAWNSYRGEKNKIYYWRTPSGSEVDFIVYGSEVFWAIEVKNSNKLKPEDLRHLITFKKDYPEAKTMLLYRGKDRLMKNGILCMPCEEFLFGLDPDKKKMGF